MEIEEVVKRLKKGKTILIKRKAPITLGGLVTTIFRSRSDPSLYCITAKGGDGTSLGTRYVYEKDLEKEMRGLL